MKQLLYYTLDSKFVSDQKAVGGEGNKVVSVVNGVAWTKDERKAYYRYLKPNSGNVTSYTITIHYKDVNGNEIAPDDFVTVEGYVGYGVSKTIMAKSISGYTVLVDGAKTFIINGNIEHTFIYVGSLEETPLMFYILSGGTIAWKAKDGYYSTRTIQYSKNGGEWTDITSSTNSVSIDVVAGDIVKFRGNNNRYCDYNRFIYTNSFSSSTPDLRFNAYGNIMSLINSTDFKNLKTFTTQSAFTGLFSGCTSLVSADGLLLPATSLTKYCYSSMFAGCKNLIQTPELPATRLASDCYHYMFNGCSSLTTAPELPATRLESNCYEYMFYGCTRLTTAPELPATTLAYKCYYAMFLSCTSLITTPELPATTLAGYCYTSMFQGCTGLTTVSKLPATTLEYDCYNKMFYGCKSLITAPELPATALANSCYYEMFYGCTNLIQAPSLPVTKLISYCYYGMFNGCTRLTTAPELPATTLADFCYQYMFNGCSSLNYIKCLATNISASNCTDNWVSRVAASGTFVKNPNMLSWSTGVSGIPSGWTITNATS